MLTAEQRDHIRRARDAAKRAGWDAHARQASKLAPETLLGALSHEWQTTTQVADRLGVRRPERPRLGRLLAELPEVEVWRYAGPRPQTRYRLKKFPPAG
jgi:hypothetical protein